MNSDIFQVWQYEIGPQIGVVTLLLCFSLLVDVVVLTLGKYKLPALNLRDAALANATTLLVVIFIVVFEPLTYRDTQSAILTFLAILIVVKSLVLLIVKKDNPTWKIFLMMAISTALQALLIYVFIGNHKIG